MGKEFFIMENKHVESCGIPPVIKNEKSDQYFSYFENEHGEQWVFVYDPEIKKAELRGGDAGWDNVFIVENGQAKELVLNLNEKEWLQACWKSATRLS